MSIMLDEDLHKKLRDLRAKKIKSGTGDTSFSKVLNDVLRKQLK